MPPVRFSAIQLAGWKLPDVFDAFGRLCLLARAERCGSFLPGRRAVAGGISSFWKKSLEGAWVWFIARGS